MKIELNDESDLWQLFGGSDPEKPGRWQRSFKNLRMHIYDTKPFHRRETTAGKLKQRFSLSDTDRHYLLVGGQRAVRVDQRRLLNVGKALKDRDLIVQYLGADLKTECVRSNPEESARVQRTAVKKRREKSTSTSKNQTKKDPNVGHYLLLVETLGAIINPKFWKADSAEVRRSQVSHWMGVSIKRYTDNELRTMNEEALQALHQCALELDANEDLAPQLERVEDTLRQRGLEPNTSCDAYRLLALLREKVAQRPEELYRGLRGT